MTYPTSTRRRLAQLLVGATAAMSITIGGSVAVSAGGVKHTDRLTVTYDEDTFRASSRRLVTETFDHPTEFPPAKRTVAFRGVKFRSNDAADPYWKVDGGLYRGFSGDGPDSPAVGLGITFRNRGAVRNFGFRLDPFGTPNQFVIKVIEIDGTVTRRSLPTNTGDRFVGLNSRIGIAKIVIVQDFESVGGATNFAIDEFSRSPIFPLCRRTHR